MAVRKIKGPKKTVSVVMPLEVYNALAKLAEEDDRSVPSYIRLSLRKQLEQNASVFTRE